MVAQAEQVAPEGVANDQPSEEAVSNKLDNDDDGHGGHDETPAGGKQSDSRGDKEPVEPFEKAEGCEAEEEAAIEPDSPAIFAEKSTAAPIPDAEAEQEDKAALETSPIRDSSFTHSARGVSTTLNETDTIMDETPNPGADSPDPALPPDSSATEVETAGIVSAGTPDDPSTLLPAAEQASVPFPQITRVETSHSIHSTLSENDSGASTSDVTELAPVEGKDKEKRRTRLSSLKGFVRRISDHQSTRSPGGVNKAVPSGKSPMGEMDEATAMLSANVSASGSPNGEVGDKRKKRLSLKKKD